MRVKYRVFLWAGNTFSGTTDGNISQVIRVSGKKKMTASGFDPKSSDLSQLTNKAGLSPHAVKPVDDVRR